MNAVAYCRVSTNKDEQLDSMEAQQNFFSEYALRNNLNLVRIYADEGKSGTRIHNRTQLLKLLKDAQDQEFQLVLIKDVSRLARNTVDFLTSIRKLKNAGIKVVFVNYDQTSSESSEFMLTMLSAIAQEESANTSKRVKFGKKINAEKGRVPNLIFGYDKIPGEYFTLNINEREADIVKEIFTLYVHEGMGTARIAQNLNSRHILTKRECLWTQTAVNRILSNPIYTGKVINGKEEVEDFLTGKRKSHTSERWNICENDQIKIIEEDVFEKAQRIMYSRVKRPKAVKERLSDKHIFSKLIRCSECKASFRRYERVYKNKKVKWVCSTRNLKGADMCSNKTTIDENVLVEELKAYLLKYLKNLNGFLEETAEAYQKENNIISETEVKKQIEKLKKTKMKYVSMYERDIIDIEELKEYTENVNDEMNQLKDLITVSASDTADILREEFRSFSDVLNTVELDFYFANKIIQTIEAENDNKINVYLKKG